MHFSFALLWKQWTKEKKEDDMCISEEKTKEKQNSVTIIISVDGKGTIFPVKLKIELESFK